VPGPPAVYDFNRAFIRQPRALFSDGMLVGSGLCPIYFNNTLLDGELNLMISAGVESEFSADIFLMGYGDIGVRFFYL
jgi:hypothetical protein